MGGTDSDDDFFERFSIYGWDDGCVYFYNGNTGKELNITKHRALYEKLVETCVDYPKCQEAGGKEEEDVLRHS